MYPIGFESKSYSVLSVDIEPIFSNGGILVWDLHNIFDIIHHFMRNKLYKLKLKIPRYRIQVLFSVSFVKCHIRIEEHKCVYKSSHLQTTPLYRYLQIEPDFKNLKIIKCNWNNFKGKCWFKKLQKYPVNDAHIIPQEYVVLMWHILLCDLIC